jgi:hypothetical protein
MTQNGPFWIRQNSHQELGTDANIRRYIRLAVRRRWAAGDAVSLWGSLRRRDWRGLRRSRLGCGRARSRFRQSARRLAGRACPRAAIAGVCRPKCGWRGQTELMRVVVTLIGPDGAMGRRMADTAASSDTGAWGELLVRALAAVPAYRAVPGGRPAGQGTSHRYCETRDDLSCTCRKNRRSGRLGARAVCGRGRA